MIAAIELKLIWNFLFPSTLSYGANMMNVSQMSV